MMGSSYGGERPLACTYDRVGGEELRRARGYSDHANARPGRYRSIAAQSGQLGIFLASVIPQ